MSELSPDARDLVAQARRKGPELLGPSAEQRARLREKLTPLWAAEAPAPRVWPGLRWKLAAALVIAGLGAFGALFLRSEPEAVLRAVSQQPTAASPADSVQDTNPSTCDPSAPRGSERACAQVAAAACDPGAPRGPERACGQVAAAACDPGAPHGSKRACPRAASLPHAVAPALRKPPARRAEHALESEGVGVAVGSVRPEHDSTDDQDAPAASSARGSDCVSTNVGAGRRGACAPAREPGAQQVSADAKQSERGRRVPMQAARVERPPLTAAEDHTPARNVDTDQDPAPPSIDGELELLGAAQAALQKQRPSRALTLLQEHAFRFPTGSLVEERMAMQALALCALQRRHAAATVLSSLEARGSTSQLLPRVRSQCGL